MATNRGRSIASGVPARVISAATGKYAAATVTGTIWLTEDTCTNTLVRVRSGVVDVYDAVLRKHVTVQTGQSYRARAR